MDSDGPHSENDLDDTRSTDGSDPLDGAVAAVHMDVKSILAGLKEVHAAVSLIVRALQASTTRGPQ